MTNFLRLHYLFKQSLPLTLSSLCLLLMGVSDAFFISHKSMQAFTAQALAAIILMTIFMGLIAFIFPLANFIQLHPNNKQGGLKAGLVLTLSLALVATLACWISASFIGERLLPLPVNHYFTTYFRFAALRFLPGASFIYLRMVNYTGEQPKQITLYLFMGFSIYILLALLCYHFIDNTYVLIIAFASLPTLIFTLLTLILNQMLSDKKRIQYIFHFFAKNQDYYDVLRTCIPAMLTSLLEYAFFCYLGIALVLKTSNQLAIYRIIMQLEEVLILFFYGLASVISIEISKGIKALNSDHLKRDKIIFILLSLISGISIFYLLPYILYMFNIQFQSQQFVIAILTAMLLVSESIMLLTISCLRSFACNHLILYITIGCNWFIVIAAMLLLQKVTIVSLLSILIINYLLIAGISYTQFRHKLFLAINNKQLI